MILPPSPTGEIWIAKIAVEVVLLALLAKRHLGTKYLGLTIYLAVATVKSLAILYAMQTPGGYYPMWLRTHWLTIGAQAVLTLDLLIAFAAHFRGIRSFAAVLYSAFAAASLYGSGLVYQMGSAWWSFDVQRAASHTKYYGLALCGVLLLSRLFFWLYRRRVKVATNARRIASAAVFVMLAGAAGYVAPHGLPSDLCTVGAPLSVWAWLALRLRQSGEDGVIPPPASPEDLGRWERERVERERQLIEKVRLARKLR